MLVEKWEMVHLVAVVVVQVKGGEWWRTGLGIEQTLVVQLLREEATQSPGEKL